MYRKFVHLLFAGFIVATAPRLPAPIQELPETPTPATKPSEPIKHRKSGPKESPTAGPRQNVHASSPASPIIARSKPTFAGTWTGTLTGSASGTLVTVTVNSAQDSAAIKGLPIWEERRGSAHVDGNTLSWNFMAESWNMVIAPDGQTMVIVGHHWPSGTSTGTLHRVE